MACGEKLFESLLASTQGQKCEQAMLRVFIVLNGAVGARHNPGGVNIL